MAVREPSEISASENDVFRIILLYAAFSVVWILVSDKAVLLLFPDPEQMSLLSTIKGCLYTVMSSLLLYGLMRRLRKRDPALKEHPYAPHPIMPIIPVCLVIMALTVGAIVYTYKSAINDGAAANAIWIAISGLLGIFVAISGFVISRKSQALAFSLREHEIQAEKLRALQLLDGIADASADAIFAKDLNGKYIFFNREAARLVGKDRHEVPGKEASDLFPPEQVERMMAHQTVVLGENRAITVQEDLTTSEGQMTFLTLKGPLRDAEGNVTGMFGISRDITERKKAEETLRRNRDRIERINNHLLELGPDHHSNINRLTALCGELLGAACALYFRLDGGVMYSRGQWRRPRDFNTRDNPAGHICRDLISGSDEDVMLVTNLQRSSYAESDPSIREYGLQTYLGHVVKSEGNRVGALCVAYDSDYQPSDDDRRVLGIIASAIGNEDMRREAVEALQKREAKLNTILRAAPIGIGMVHQRVFREVSERICRMTGYSREELLNKDALIVYPDQEEYNRVGKYKYAQVHETGMGTITTRWKKKDGTIMDIQLDTTPLDPADFSAGFIFTALDITEKKHADDELLESRRRLLQLIEFMPDAIIIIDRNGKVLSWNRAMETMTGVGASEMIGKGDYEYAIPFYGKRKPILVDIALKPDPEIEKSYTALQRSGDMIFGEAFAPNLPPGNRHLSAMASVLRDSKGEVIAAIESIRDNTERRKLEERLQLAEKMKALGALAGGVAHDLNNVLGVIVGYSEILLYDLEESSSARSKAEEIHSSGQRAAAIVQDLLTLARRGVPTRKVLNLNSIISDFENSPEFAKLCSFHPNVLVQIEMEDGLLHISGSAVHLSKSLFNLVANAAEAMPDGGLIKIRAGNLYLDKAIRGYDEVMEGDYVVLSVSDTGEGIAEADLKRIFEPFYTKKVMGRSGTGLGLAVVWGTVKDHRGYVNVESEVGRGTTFTLYFPVTREALALEQSPDSVSDYMGRGESILVVDDVEEQRKLAGTILKRLNYKVASAASGEEAVEYLSGGSADLVVLDMIMGPGMDGLATYMKILEIHPRQKAIIVSGYSETDRVTRAQALGAGPYVRKPYVMEKLGLAIKAELGKPEK